jgi:hypothetical protein
MFNTESVTQTFLTNPSKLTTKVLKNLEFTHAKFPLCRAFFKDFPVGGGGDFLKRDLSVR